LNGHKPVVRILLNQEGIDVNFRDNAGRTPLFLAIQGGHTEIVMQLMIAKERSNINTTDSTGQTPLSLAASHGHEAVVKMILEVPSVDVS
ncbi:ankyrin, partial [Serendipita vermifera]